MTCRTVFPLQLFSCVVSSCESCGARCVLHVFIVFHFVVGDPALLLAITAVFMEQHAPGKKFYCWKFKPREGMTVWTFWNLLVDQDIAFIPGNSDRGVFPIIFLKGTFVMASCIPLLHVIVCAGYD